MAADLRWVDPVSAKCSPECEWPLQMSNPIHRLEHANRQPPRKRAGLPEREESWGSPTTHDLFSSQIKVPISLRMGGIFPDKRISPCGRKMCLLKLRLILTELFLPWFPTKMLALALGGPNFGRGKLHVQWSRSSSQLRMGPNMPAMQTATRSIPAPRNVRGSLTIPAILNCMLR